jgi:hypothetical protein
MIRKIRRKFRGDWYYLRHSYSPADSFTLRDWWTLVKWFAGVMIVFYLLDPHADADHDAFAQILGLVVSLLILLLLFGIDQKP